MFVKLKAKIKERIQPAKTRLHRESQDVVNNTWSSQKQQFHLPFARGEIILVAKIHKGKNAVRDKRTVLLQFCLIYVVHVSIRLST